MRAALTTSAVIALTLATAACSSKKATTTGATSPTIDAGDSTCVVSRTSFDPGRVSFAVTNKGADVTEVYVYGKSSAGTFDKIVGEREDIAPGTSADLDVSLTGGEYEVACKPGQKGAGIRQRITVTGATASASASESESGEAEYDRELTVEAKDFEFEGLDGFTAKVGEKVEFKLENEGSSAHDLTIAGPDGDKVAQIAAVAPGKDDETIVSFTEAGTYTYTCSIDGHAGKGMKGTFTVTR